MTVKPKVVVSSEGITSNTVLKNKDVLIKECAKLLKDDILQYTKTYAMPWPLTIDRISEEEKSLPDSVTDFLTNLMKSVHGHNLSDSSKRLVSSYSSDLISAISGGKVVTLKHFLLGVGLHNITG